jgi:hypothetical protein
MGHDKRVYRLVQDTRFGRKTLVESPHTDTIVKAVTQYVARRIIERDRALAGAAGDAGPAGDPGRRWRGVALFVLGALAGATVLLASAWFVAPFVY